MQVRTGFRKLVCGVLAYAVSANASLIVQLKIIDGEGMVYHTGARATRGLTVLVTDETGKPVENASVSFRLPEDGATGVFSTGLRTEVVSTGSDGRASVWGMQWSKTPGAVEVRVTAAKDQARAGIVATQYLSDASEPVAGGQGVFTPSHKGRGKWLLMLAIVGGGAAAGAAFGMSHSANPSPTSTAPPGLSIGAPSIIVGHQ